MRTSRATPIGSGQAWQKGDAMIKLGEHYTWEVKECTLQFQPDLHQCFTLHHVERRLLQLYPGWYVYCGGSHVALHRASGDGERLLLIVEKPDIRDRLASLTGMRDA
jgi:hypothetical protein